MLHCAYGASELINYRKPNKDTKNKKDKQTNEKLF